MVVSPQSETAVKRGPELIAVSKQDKTLDKGRTVSVINLKGLLTGSPKIFLVAKLVRYVLGSGLLDR